MELASETDTEVIAQLVGRRSADMLLEDAVREALSMVVGTYGLAVVDDRQPDCIVVARNGSPVVLGVGRRAHFVASDVTALVRHTDQVVHLDDHEMAVLRADSYRTFTLDARPTDKRPATTEVVATAFDRAGHEHFHAQGDPRAAGVGRPDAERAARAALRHRPPGRAST